MAEMRLKMKKILSAALLCALVALSGCGSSNGGGGNNIEPEELTYSVSNKVYTEEYEEDGTKIAMYIYDIPVLTPSNEEGNAVAESFNKAMEEIAAERIEKFESEIYTLAKEDYALKKESGTEWGDRYYTDEIKFTYVQSINYIGIGFDTYTNYGGPHPRTGFIAAMYDLRDGKPFTYEDITDDPDGLREAMAEELLVEIRDGGIEEYMDEGYSLKVQNLEEAQIYFSEDGAVVIFPQYVLSAQMGSQTMLVDYGVIDPYLNDFGRDMLFEYTGVMG